jgi:hypothetical protein
MPTRQPVPTLRETISQWAADHEVELIFFDPPEHFDHAIVGLVEGAGQTVAVLYDQAMVLAAMRADMVDAADDEAAIDEEAADEVLEWFTVNTLGAYVGEATPRFLIRPWEEVPDEQET